MPNTDVMVVPLNRLTRLYDSVEQLEDLWVDDEGTVDEGEEVEVWEMGGRRSVRSPSAH